MKLTITGEIKEYPEGTTLRQLVEKEEIQTPEYVTVSVNDDLYGARDFDNVILKDADTIEFLYFMGGGAL